MKLITIRIPKRRYDALVSAVAALLEEHGVAGAPNDDFDVETLEGVGEFEQFDVVRDFAVRLGRADAIKGEDDGDDGKGDDDGGGGDHSDSDDNGDGVNEFEIEVHAHHLVALVAAFPDLTGAADVPEPDLSVAVQGLCYAYLDELADTSKRRGA